VICYEFLVVAAAYVWLHASVICLRVFAMYVNQEAAQLVVCVLCLLCSAGIDIAELRALPVMLF
jgi:hypothetical protein